ncbi:inositol monophosphatase family protein [Aestuariispira ectoiniformans]|uniref:inositol monophosphatase family protein n=1 Tax=Aestuariispira ectoiniformans TaxID=2775080 RepID=UPI00223AD090|nr:inositol monophosphatase family protein [Aestuariispira ectoiniformans]
MIVRSAALNVMTKAAEKAGRALVRDFGEVEQLQVSRKGPADFVSSADRKAERIIREELQKARPEYGFLMEEGGEIASDDEHRFIIDPLDGTSNFLHGLPHFAVSIALEKKGEVIAGVIYDPVKDELFWAEKGKGAFLNSRRLRVSARARLSDSIFATGIPFMGMQEGEGHQLFLRRLEKVMGKTAGVRRWGAAALDLAYVAAGRYDGFWERGLNPWDVAAGLLMVKEAGGFVTDAQGRQYKFKSEDLVAGNDKIHKSLLDLLRSAK